MDWMSESGQVNLAHVTKKQKYKMNKLKQTPVPSAHLIRSRSNILEDSPNGTRNWQEDYGGKANVKQIRFMCGEKDQGSDRW